MKRRIISGVLVLSMVLSIGLAINVEAVQSKYYTDVFTSDTYYSAVNYLYEHEIIK